MVDYWSQTTTGSEVESDVIWVNDMYAGQIPSKVIGGGGYSVLPMEVGQQSLAMAPTDCLAVCCLCIIFM